MNLNLKDPDESNQFRPKSGIFFAALGGAEEIGMNLNLYGTDDSWIMIDLGVTFDSRMDSGSDIIMPNPEFILQNKDKLKGLVLTHAHEDHIGAVPYFFEELDCPIYATAFTASVLERKIRELGISINIPIHVVPTNGNMEIGPFNLEFFSVTHSIPDPSAVLLRTKFGNIFHTGDWKFDNEPTIGKPTDITSLKKIGDEGILALVCDSTNIFESGSSGSEGSLFNSLDKLIKQRKFGRIIVSCFSSNVARLKTISKVAKKNNRNVVLVGRSMWRFYQAAKDNGYLNNVDEFLNDDCLSSFKDEETLIICTGSQGDFRAALYKIAFDKNKNISVGKGDLVIFSSKRIPGNEISIDRIQDRFASKGVEVITEDDAFVHVSGHPSRDELALMYSYLRPKIVIPVHGEEKHIKEHVKFALACQISDAGGIANGDVVKIAPGKPRKISSVKSGRLILAGKELFPFEKENYREERESLKTNL